MARARNMQKLTEQVKERWPGVVVYGIGDEAHTRSASGHNEDDNAGSKPEQEDPDSKPEHRAIDIMLGPAFSRAQAWELVTALVTRPANRARLLYVIFDGWSWSASRGWVKRATTGDPHRDHPHVSGTWQDDENTAPWEIGAPTPEVPDMQVITIARDRFGQWYACTGSRSWKITQEQSKDIATLAKEGRWDICWGLQGVGHPRDGWYPEAFGPLDEPAGAVTVTADLMRALGDQVLHNVGPAVRQAVEAAIDARVEAAVRRVLGGLDNVVPPA